MQIRWLCLAAAAALSAAMGGSASDVLAAPSAATVRLTKLVTKLPAGDEMQVLQDGPFCVAIQKEVSHGDITEAKLGLFGPAFADAFGDSARTTASTSVDLFGATHNPEAADFQVGGVITKARGAYCLQGVIGVKVEANIAVQWQIYSTAQGKVLATIETSGSTKYRSRTLDPVEALRLAFVDSVKKLAASPEVQAAFANNQTSEPQDARSGPFATLSAQGGKQNGRPLSDTVGSVVVVSLGDSFGSGVLVSSDGYILTNEHVVGRARAVRIRWSDGFETAGEVVRTHAGRDVALIKTDPRGREPLAVRTGAVQPGETVVAIGAPLDKELQGTLTRGVMSANRILRGYSFIQSDVMVNHGNSGGPLLDDKGLVIGLTDLGIQPDGVPTGLNLFIPIKDALDFLAIDLAPTPSATAPAQKTPVSQAGGSVSAR